MKTAFVSIAFCPNCEKDTLKLSCSNKLYNIEDWFNSNESKEILNFKCTNCNKVFFIDWRDKFPKPLYNIDSLNNFILKKLH